MTQTDDAACGERDYEKFLRTYIEKKYHTLVDIDCGANTLRAVLPPEIRDTEAKSPGFICNTLLPEINRFRRAGLMQEWQRCERGLKAQREAAAEEVDSIDKSTGIASRKKRKLKNALARSKYSETKWLDSIAEIKSRMEQNTEIIS